MKLVYLWMFLVIALFGVTLYLALRLYVIPPPKEFPQNTAEWPSIAQMRAMSVEAAETALSDVTVRHFMGPVTKCLTVQTATGSEQKCEEHWAGHGTFLEYFAPDGRVYLWYPGREEPVIGAWYVRGNVAARFICLGYTLRDANLRDDAYQEPECITIRQFYRTVEDAFGGDLFDLSRGEVRHVLSREEASFEALWRK